MGESKGLTLASNYKPNFQYQLSCNVPCHSNCVQCQEVFRVLTLNTCLQASLSYSKAGTGQLKCGGTRAETRFCLLAKRTSPFKSAGASVQSTTGSWGVRMSGSNAGYTMFRGSVKGTGYTLHSPVSPSLPLPCGTVCHHISTAVYCLYTRPAVSVTGQL